MYLVGLRILCSEIFLLALVSCGFLSQRNILITSFKYQLCDPKTYPKNIAWVKEADVLSTANGDLDVLGTLVTTVNLTAPIKALVKLRRKLMGIYVPLPCLRKFGSCNYPDLCTYGFATTDNCPPILEENDVPCRCPIKQGIYTLPGGQFPMPKTRWAGVLAGEYKGQVGKWLWPLEFAYKERCGLWTGNFPGVFVRSIRVVRMASTQK